MTLETKYVIKNEDAGHIDGAIFENDKLKYMIHRGKEHEILVSVIKMDENQPVIQKTADGIYNPSLDKIEERKDFQKLIGRFFDKYTWPAGPIPEETGLEKFINNLRFGGKKYEDL